MVRKDGDTMKECMKTNNPTEFRDSAEVRFNKAMDAYEMEQNITPDLSNDVSGFDVSVSPNGGIKRTPIVPDKDVPRGITWHPAKVVNTSYNVNVRAEATLDSSVIGYIHPDSEFMISAVRTPDWYKVRLKDGTEGYASSKYVAKVMPNEHT